MTKPACGQGYSPLGTDEDIIASFIRRYGYRSSEPETWTRTPTAIIVPVERMVEDD